MRGFTTLVPVPELLYLTPFSGTGRGKNDGRNL